MPHEYSVREEFIGKVSILNKKKKKKNNEFLKCVPDTQA